MTFAFPSGAGLYPSLGGQGDDPLLNQVFRVAGLVVDVAAGEDLARHLNTFDQAALPHVPSWRGPDRGFNQQEVTRARVASDLLAAEIILFRQQTLRLRLDVNLVNDLQFALAVTADAYLTRTPWSGQNLWKKAPLEARLFDTTLGLDEVTRRVEQLAPQRRIDDKRLHQAYRFLLAVLGGGVGEDKETAVRSLDSPAVMSMSNPLQTADFQTPDENQPVQTGSSVLGFVLIASLTAVLFALAAFAIGWAGVRLWAAAQLAALWGG